MAAAIGTALLGACTPRKGATAATPSSSPIGSWMLRVRPADFPELAQKGGIARVDGTSSMPVAVVRTADGYSVFSLRCPHAGVTVEAKDGRFVCPGHGATFTADGTWVDGHRAKNLRALDSTFDASAGVLTIVG